MLLKGELGESDVSRRFVCLNEIAFQAKFTTEKELEGLTNVSGPEHIVRVEPKI